MIYDWNKPHIDDRHFLLLIQQWLLGLDLRAILANEPYHKRWLSQLQERYNFNKSKQIHFNLQLSQLINDEMIEANYDCITQEHSFHNIHYFRTHEIINKELIEKDYKNQISLWLLKEKFEAQPDAITINYWFLTEIELLHSRIEYTETLHRQITKNLLKPKIETMTLPEIPVFQLNIDEIPKINPFIS
ncbi:hypothetical protein C7H19_24770 [Aphanothece hegewaldii CCALA 016]|uniref:Uncharacterized protein n=1 Tax=Aphanothece hegewaldii CCALA 016 TaxID=2107694 RepID=A0A2T1LQH2_9CHRO|nr:hypothetical protein [Aphanothece hegewaldii]PSF28132.1 hypothetical protein C7H19_24770 [Aphanothece hegewaldii CCALA 016]